MNVVLIGMKHCGKSTLGSALAARWECPFHDVDTMIESTYQCDAQESLSVREILAEHGEPRFREIEGQANRFGYFQPPPGTAMILADPGEFRVDIVASYADSEGVQWMGSATWGNVVERPGTNLYRIEPTAVNELEVVRQR